jgi:leader peptidase (prepilin peptidase)/N-methyltransferase
MLLWWWVLLALLVIVLVYDFYHYIIPDELTLAVLGLALVWLGYGGLQTGDWLFVLYTTGAAVAGSGFLYSLWWWSGGRWLGFGDVKLVFPLGLLVGYTKVFSLVVASFWIGAVVSLGILGYQRWQTRGKPPLRQVARGLTMKSAVPFAPFLIAAALLILFTNFNALSFFY